MNPYLCSRKKRALDILFTLIALPVVLPLLIITAFLVFLSMGTPVVFAQKRVGRNGKTFIMFKLRSLKRSFTNQQGVKHNNGDITPLGKFIRILRLDEFPQIWNILKGEMSWIGPRPEVPYYMEKYNEIEPRFAERTKALPGITGLAQLDNPNATPDHNLEKLGHDLEYVEKATLWMDIGILFKTIFIIWKK